MSNPLSRLSHPDFISQPWRKILLHEVKITPNFLHDCKIKSEHGRPVGIGLINGYIFTIMVKICYMVLHINYVAEVCVFAITSYYIARPSHCTALSLIGKFLGKAFDIPKNLLGETFFAAVTLKVSDSASSCKHPRALAKGWALARSPTATSYGSP